MLLNRMVILRHRMGPKTSSLYLLYDNFIVYTDHAALGWFLTITDPSGRLMRWVFRLAEFYFHIQYKRVNTITKADALSRLKSRQRQSRATK